jgi:hypothetical protein
MALVECIIEVAFSCGGLSRDYYRYLPQSSHVRELIVKSISNTDSDGKTSK